MASLNYKKAQQNALDKEIGKEDEDNFIDRNFGFLRHKRTREELYDPNGEVLIDNLNGYKGILLNVIV